MTTWRQLQDQERRKGRERGEKKISVPINHSAEIEREKNEVLNLASIKLEKRNHVGYSTEKGGGKKAFSLFSSQSNKKVGQIHSPWIFDCGATNTMTYDPFDIISPTPTNRTHIQTANGECVSVTEAGTVDISSSIHLNNCLMIPSLSHKLLSISHLTKELNCIVLMSSTDCVVQDA